MEIKASEPWRDRSHKKNLLSFGCLDKMMCVGDEREPILASLCALLSFETSLRFVSFCVFDLLEIRDRQ
jgi:hypothetical protein